MLRVALTGGIASGKSQAADAFRQLGAPVIDADEAARAVTAKGSPTLDRLAAVLPDTSWIVNGVLDRARLRDALFRDPALRRRVERVLHPAISARLRAAIEATDADYAVVAIPLLTEAGRSDWVDRVLVVDCPEAVQIERLKKRDGETEAGARRILAAQAGRAERLELADDVIDNSGSLDDLRARVRAADTRFRRLSRQSAI